MAKSFKLRVTRLIHSAFQSCRSKDPSTLPHDPLPYSSSYIYFSSSVNPKYVAVDHFPTTNNNKASPPESRPSDIKPPPEEISNCFSEDSSDGREFKWKEEDKWHVVAKVFEESQKPRRKIYNSSASGDSGEDEISPLPRLSLTVAAAERRSRRGKSKKVKIPARPHHHRTSTSSAESGLFSNDEEENLESETLVSTSRSFSTDSSSEYIPQLETIREKPLTSRRRGKKRAKRKQPQKRAAPATIYRPSSVSESESPARLSVFQKLIPCSVDGKVKESFAVIKKSEDPYEDFKRSMMEMILEKQMFEESDLEQLLQCFLSLNSRDHHRLIVQAFVEIWEAMFCASDRHSSSNNHTDSSTKTSGV
ncbi:OLC1v1010814C1 [Oldenlandia corymbosa var. corymbosa]|uniref:Transcription repressor n=1 Tax=Oldenlandia corymbosa var. corymbosa TaxID=529605 RepID=A0AAV1DV02_OLDCO|nr:OLC1v1010814C1 [Oldenlandia corymbosa var. corymbosa]